MRKSAILITGANGEIGRGLILSCQKLNTFNIVTLDINKLDNSIKPFVDYRFKSILNALEDISKRIS